MSVAALIPVEQYLNTSYSPDCEYVDGVLVERSAGASPHSQVQSNIVFALRSRYRNLRVWPEQRVQVSDSRFRIPDICVTDGHPRTRIFDTPPLIAIEILSRDDSLPLLQRKIDEYLGFGIPNVWVIDPWNTTAYVCEPAAIRKVTSGFLEVSEPAILVPLAEIFDLD